MGLEPEARLSYFPELQQALATLPLAKMYDVDEDGATAVVVERATTGLKERYDGIVRDISEAQFTGKGDKEKVSGSIARSMDGVTAMRGSCGWGERRMGGRGGWRGTRGCHEHHPNSLGRAPTQCSGR